MSDDQQRPFYETGRVYYSPDFISSRPIVKATTVFKKGLKRKARKKKLRLPK